MVFNESLHIRLSLCCMTAIIFLISKYIKIKYINVYLKYDGENGKRALAKEEQQLNKSYIKMNDQLWFYGKNYASANIAPVPSGFSYGNITTNAIGFVDMRTQEFTAAPNGTVLKLD